MNDHGVSAFEAYAAKKSKKKNKNVDLKIKSKEKMKKKRKKINDGFTIVDTVHESTGLNTTDISDKVEKKQTQKKDLINSLLKEKKESIFKDCNLTTKVDNLFLKESSSSESDLKNKIKKSCEEEIGDHTVKVKKTKKRKKINGDCSGNHKRPKLCVENSENFNLEKKLNIINDVKKSTVEVKNDISKTHKKYNLNKLDKQGFKHPKFIYSDSVKVGEEIFSWMLSPMDVTEFFRSCWEQKPLHIKHNNENYFKSVCTMKDFKTALRENDMYFTRNIDVTSYVDGQRFTENPEGKATPSLVWDLYKIGKSIRLLNPQTFIPNIRLLNTTLQEFFQCFVGSNIYLTPPGTQGFAPHYDDIEAFVLQLEGEKQWKLYNAKNENEILPRVSSKNFSEDEIGEPILEVTLQPGDLLYFPRGVIHQAKCMPHVHSLHVTVSCYQKNSWADLFEKVLPVALEEAIYENVEFRKGLPIGYLNHLGMVYDGHDSEQRRGMIKKFKKLAQKLIEYCPLDAAVDQLGATFMHDALPPCLTEEEKLCGADRNFRIDDKCVLEALKNYSDKNLGVKLIRATSVRLVSEQGEVVLYYTTDNSFVYREHEAFSVSVSIDWARATEYLIHSYPKFVPMEDLPVSSSDKKPAKWRRIVEFVYFLWQKGLLLFEKPLQHICN